LEEESILSIDDRAVNSKADFIFFLKELSKNYKNSPDEWETKKMGAFFEAMARWVEEREGYYQSNNIKEPADINWGFIANMFLAAKIHD
jgi:hypothetical protein